MYIQNVKYIKPTFNLPDKSYYTGGVKGNGITIGLTDGTKNYGFAQATYLTTRDNFYGSSVGAWTSGSPIADGKSTGLTTDSSKSGIIVESDSQLKLCIKY